MSSMILLIDKVLELYTWALVIAVVLSWLTSFNMINTSNRFVYLLVDFFYRITEPALRPIRRFIPSFSGIDLSPIVLILVIWFARNLLREYGL